MSDAAAIMKGDDAMEEMAEAIASAMMETEGEEEVPSQQEQQQEDDEDEAEAEEQQEQDEDEEQQQEEPPAPKPKKRRTKKDPSAPKRPMSSFLYFAQSRRPSIQQENPELDLPGSDEAPGPRVAELIAGGTPSPC